MEKIRVCADSFPPYQYIDESGKIRGSDYELVTEKLRRAGYEPEVWIGSWNQIYKAFEEGKQDVLFQAQDSPERLKRFYFSKMLRYAVTEVVTIKPELWRLQNYTSLQQYKIGIIAGFTNGPEIDSLSADCKVEFVSTEDMLEGLGSGKVDCGICDQGVRKYLKTQVPDVYSIPKLTYQRPLYVMFRKEKHRDDFDAVDNDMCSALQ